jgi:mitogen-activated protein kinase 7
MGHKDPIPWAKMYPKANKKAINFLNRMLVLNPKNRITVEQALVHPYLNKYHDPDDEPICIPTFNFDFESKVSIVVVVVFLMFFFLNVIKRQSNCFLC